MATNNKNIIIWIIVAVLVVGGGFWLWQQGYSGQTTVDQGPEASAGAIQITSGNLFFRPNTLTVTKDEPVTISFRNTGSHTFTIDELGVNQPIRGATATVEFTPTKSGTFEYYCTVPGHRKGGMKGTLTVE